MKNDSTTAHPATVNVKADQILVNAFRAEDNQSIELNITGNDGLLSDHVEMNFLSNSPAVFKMFHTDTFTMTSDNNSFIVEDGIVTDTGTIRTKNYYTQVSAFFQPLSVFDYQIYTKYTDFNLLFTGQNLFSTNIASYVNPDVLFNAIYRTEESILSTMEKINSRNEVEIYDEIQSINNYLNYLLEAITKDLELFESHIEEDSLVSSSED